MTLTLTANTDWIITNNEAAAAGASAPAWLKPLTPAAPDSRHEAVLFLKPEVQMLGSDKIPAFLKMIDTLCAKYDVEIQNIGCLGYDYLAKYGIINDHYGVIGNLAANGMKALTPELQQKVRDTFPDVAVENIQGSIEFLNKHPNIAPEELGAAWEARNTTHTKKLAPGTHTQQMTWEGKEYVVFVGFFPLMAAHFTAKGRSIIAMPVRSTTPWETLRNTMIGDTDPAQAVAGSFRADLLANKDTLGMAIVNKGQNGVHMSAGGLEGMVELIRFASNRATGETLDATNTNFGAAWLAAGGSKADLQTLQTNPLVNVNGKTISAFDATEHVDMAPAIATLTSALKQAA